LLKWSKRIINAAAVVADKESEMADAEG